MVHQRTWPIFQKQQERIKADENEKKQFFARVRMQGNLERDALAGAFEGDSV